MQSDNRYENSNCSNLLFERLGDIRETVYFSEEETALLLSGAKYENMPKELSEKIDMYGIKWFYESLPRNLKALFDNA